MNFKVKIFLFLKINYENYLDKILAKGSQKANNLATKKINEIKTLVGF